MKSYFFSTLMIIGFAFILTNCSDDTGDTDDSVNVDLEVQMRVGSETLSDGSTYTINGTTIQVNAARFYLGNISLDGNSNLDDDTYYVVSENNKSFNLAEVEEGDYTFAYGIGIDPDNNAQTTEDFTTRPPGDPLGLQEPTMHWNWNTGYKFLRVDGMVDTDGDNVVDTAVEYHLGTNEFFTTLQGTDQISLTPEDNAITIRFDLAGLLDGVDISTGAVTHVGDNKPMADQMLANYTKAFQIIN